MWKGNKSVRLCVFNKCKLDLFVRVFSAIHPNTHRLDKFQKKFTVNNNKKKTQKQINKQVTNLPA